MNAVVDALRRAYGIEHIDMPATPARVRAAIAAAAGDEAGGVSALRGRASADIIGSNNARPR